MIIKNKIQCGQTQYDINHPEAGHLEHQVGVVGDVKLLWGMAFAPCIIQVYLVLVGPQDLRFKVLCQTPNLSFNLTPEEVRECKLALAYKVVEASREATAHQDRCQAEIDQLPKQPANPSTETCLQVLTRQALLERLDAAKKALENLEAMAKGFLLLKDSVAACAPKIELLVDEGPSGV